MLYSLKTNSYVHKDDENKEKPRINTVYMCLAKVKEKINEKW